MKRSNLIAVLLAFLAVACQPQVDRFTLNGQISQADGKTLYLDHMALDKVEVLDSVKLDAEGNFAFNPASPKDCFDFYRLRIDNKVVNLVIDSTETITVSSSLPVMQTDYTVEGSKDCSKLKELVLRQIEFLQDLRSVYSEYGNSNAVALEEKIMEMVDVFKSDVMTEFILSTPGSPCAYYALFLSINGQLLYNPQTDRQDARCYAAVATQMDIKYPDAVRTTHLRNVALKGMAKTSPSRNNDVSEETIQKFESLIEETGLIEIELPDYKGNNRKLSDLKGNVVLLDFTAFKTDYSPNYNLMLRTLYNKYADKGFNIYQVSLDNDESYWVNTASNLPWVCVRDESSVYSTYLKSYNVQRLPTAFLIDRDGNIFDRPDNTDELDGKIAGLLE
ncbi:MAG: redoxin domain-containing protein [Bacteroidaceae bacterium]|nr:redoxin domain-containing protein [Bacteroidaceae bacterium]